MSLYAEYHLRDNPFPPSPILDPYAIDIRVNGTIFNPGIVRDAVDLFNRKIRRKPPLIYITNSDFVRGVGKSALVVHQWRQLQAHEGLTSTYIRSEKKLKPTDLAGRFIEAWHNEGYLWKVMLKILQHYTDDQPNAEMTRSGFEALAHAFPQVPRRPIPLMNYMVYNPIQLTSDVAAWAVQQTSANLHPTLTEFFFQTYLTEPAQFLSELPKVLRKQKWDMISMLATLYRLFHLGGYSYHYFFLDQFEDVIHGLSGKSLIAFNTDFRRVIEASMGYATMIVTLHPGAIVTLSSDEGGDITSIAPLDERHIVQIPILTRDGAFQLAETYISSFRISPREPLDVLYPFTEAAIDKAFDAASANIRAFLQALNYAIEKGADEAFALIDQAFLIAHHAEITGRVPRDEIQLGGL